jgi:Mu-like prophage protein gp29
MASAKRPAGGSLATRVEPLEPAAEARSMTAATLAAILEEAEGGDCARLFALYRDIITDSHISSEFNKRKNAVLGDPRSLKAREGADADAAEFAKATQTALVDTAMFRDAMSWLLNATLWPVAVVEKVFAPSAAGFDVAELRPVPFQLLDLSKSAPRIFAVDAEGKAQKESAAIDPARYITHRAHTLPIPDRWGGPMRGVLTWWLLRTMDRQWWADLLERYGVPFLKGKFSDTAGRDILRQAFALSRRLGGVIIGKNTEVEITQAATGDSSNSHERFINLCNAEISKLIVGQTLSSTATSTGIGQGASGIQQGVLDDIRRADESMLSTTLQDGLINQHAAANGRAAPVLSIGAETEADMSRLSTSLTALNAGGLEPTDDALETIGKQVGFSVRRKPAAPAPQGFPATLAALSAAAKNETRAEAIARIVREAATATEAIKAIRAWLDEHPDEDLRESLEMMMEAYAKGALKENG